MKALYAECRYAECRYISVVTPKNHLETIKI